MMSLMKVLQTSLLSGQFWPSQRYRFDERSVTELVLSVNDPLS